MAAEANDLYSVADTLAVVATVLLLFGGKAGTGHIRALLEIRHNSSFAGPLGPSDFGNGELRSQDRRSDSSASSAVQAREIEAIFAPGFKADPPTVPHSEMGGASGAIQELR
jgi:hypothetical protein